MKLLQIISKYLSVTLLVLLVHQSQAYALNTINSEIINDKVRVYWGDWWGSAMSIKYTIGSSSHTASVDPEEIKEYYIERSNGFSPGTSIAIEVRANGYWGTYEKTYTISYYPSHIYGTQHDDRITVQWDKNRYGSTPMDIRYRKSGENWEHLFNQTSGHIDLSQNGFSPGEVEVEYKFTNSDWGSAKKQSFTISNPGADFITVHKVEDRISVIWPSNKYGGSINLKYLIKETNELNYRLMQTSGNIDLSPANGFLPGDIEISYSFDSNGSYEENKQSFTISNPGADFITVHKVEDRISVIWPSNKYGGSINLKYLIKETNESNYRLMQTSGHIDLTPTNGFAPGDIDISYSFGINGSYEGNKQTVTISIADLITFTPIGDKLEINWPSYISNGNRFGGGTSFDFEFSDVSLLSQDISPVEYRPTNGFTPKEYEISYKYTSLNSWKKKTVRFTPNWTEFFSVKVDGKEVVVEDWEKGIWGDSPFDFRYKEKNSNNWIESGNFDFMDSGFVIGSYHIDGVPPGTYDLEIKSSYDNQWNHHSTFTIDNSHVNNYNVNAVNHSAIVTWNSGHYLNVDMDVRYRTYTYENDGSFPGENVKDGKWEKNYSTWYYENNRNSGTVTLSPNYTYTWVQVQVKYSNVDFWPSDDISQEVYIGYRTYSSARLNASSYSLDSSEGDLIMSVYPNPLVDQSTLEFNLGDQLEYEIKVYDLTGSVVHSKKGIGQNGINKLIIDKSDFSSKGIHIIELVSDKQIRRKKVINQ
ncbi:T9SS type A sorting domain-containing protein [Flammeovirga kamogawensis]|uniref:T9SS type A sorting domain-containing protein n=1 Tax=Flammeovirga kamogawensis TaxID=373891 RepID=A0ABX8GYH7_9BACT|nr:T9SS type A sorting domain-containing protein [Flammeovirga kamogawensis]MBB6459056.1 hypothetical protein [Flammeovirga kamogawensis]QWG08625.1 T9SS type A sorting domain-containing protein [Flammeovirga kamogawensis]TRX66918.1 T9SS type A sorting domain-containing protein [Flammeovirga kamogawensis]